MVAQVRPLVFEAPEQTELEMQGAKLERLERKQPAEVGAKAAYVGELVTMASSGVIPRHK